jgi:putative membrane protein insertion efficiency factor
MSRAQAVAIRAISFYRASISPIRPPSCRFSPSCSAYALEAVETFGLGRGLWLALRRLLRCHPFHKGGHDPVPPRVGPDRSTEPVYSLSKQGPQVVPPRSC